MHDPGFAALLNLIVSGVGQFYNGRILAGILWFITPNLWIDTGGLLTPTATFAYSYARDYRVRT